MLKNRIPPPILTMVLALVMGLAAGWPEAAPLRWALAFVVFMAAGVFGFPALRVRGPYLFVHARQRRLVAARDVQQSE